jgi:hypothetical protein
LVALVAALPPLPLAAASDSSARTTTDAAKPKTMQAAVQAAAIRNAAVVAAPRGKAAKRAEQSGTSKQSTSFFKSTPGAIALAVMIAGSGYAIYSVSNDRITSPAKK